MLDLFCGIGGCSVGYWRAGFRIVGIDCNKQRDYPFEIHHYNALHYPLRGFDIIHASPPCQAYSVNRNIHNWHDEYQYLIEPLRDRLAASGIPYIIENVVGAPIRSDLVLCGEAFGLPIVRHRLFELEGITAKAPPHITHRGKGYYVPVYGSGGGAGKTIKCWQDAMEIWWTRDKKGIANAIPPAYTEWIGRQVIGQL